MHYLLLIIFFIPQMLFAQENSPLTANEEFRALASEVMLFRDKAGDKTLADVLLLKNDFHTTKLPFNGGYTYDVYWFRITLQRTADARKDWLLSATPAFLNNLRLYSPNANGGYTLIQSGNQIAAALRPLDIQFGAFTFPVALPDTSSTVFFLRLQTQTTTSIGLSVATAEKLIQTNLQNKLTLGLILGALLIVLIMTLWLWKQKHNFSYIMLTCYILGGSLALAATEGSLTQFLFPNQAAISMLMAPIGANSIILFFTAFSISFFRTWKHFPYIHIALCGLVTLAILAFLSIALDLYPTVVTPITMTAALLIQPFQLYISWKSTHNKERQISYAVFYGFLLNLILTFCALLVVLGFISVALTPLLSIKMSLITLLLFIGMYQHFHQSEQLNQESMVRAQAAEQIATIEKQRNQDKSTFLSLVAHEIRTPLAIIDSTIQTLESQQSMPQERIEKRHLRIRQSIAHLNTLLENTLSTEYGDGQPLQPNIEQFLLAQLIKDTITPIPIISNCDIKIADNYHCTADPHLLKLALSNLLVNASKYRSTETSITLRASKNNYQQQNGTLFSISNTSISQVQPDTTEWFNKYYRAKQQANTNGLGLGLYLVKQIVQAHNGHINCSTTPTPGSDSWLITFTIWLPDLPVKEDKT